MPQALVRGRRGRGGSRRVKLHGLLIAFTALALIPWSAQAETAVTRSHGPLPPPDAIASAAAQQVEYRIGPLDVLDISVFGVENLTRTLQVDASGQINYPLIGTLGASTKTPRELGDEIAAKLGERFLQSPQVTVAVKTSLSQRFTVEGAVASPGVYDLQGKMTLLQAIATAKGVSENASIRNIVVFRTVHGKRMAGVADLAAIRSGKLTDPQIYPGDLIVVSSSSSRRWLRDIIGATPLFYIFGL